MRPFEMEKLEKFGQGVFLKTFDDGILFSELAAKLYGGQLNKGGNS